MTEQVKAVDGVSDTEARIAPFRLSVKFAERVWGKQSLAPWYTDTGTTEKVGEAWLTGAACVAETGPLTGRTLGELATQYPAQLGDGDFPLLVKMLFPAAKLSVQVHPDDEQAQARGLARGKTECWYVLEAVPGATVACGLKDGVSVADVAAGVPAGTMESLLEQVPVAVGDMIFVDAGTVHAIGPGVVLLEVQQTSDTTYRLYDYGRPRELHLDDGLAVIKLGTRAGKVDPDKEETYTRLIETEYFVIDRFELAPGTAMELPMDGIGCVVGLSGAAAVNNVEFGPGQAVIVPEGSVLLTSKDGAVVVRCWQPEK